MLTPKSSHTMEMGVDGRILSSTNEAGGKTQFGYDGHGRLSSVSDSRNVETSYVIDGLGNILQENSPESGIINYSYDEAANNTKIERPSVGIVVDRKYDQLGRLVETKMRQVGSPARTTKYVYDICKNGIGRVCRVNANGRVSKFKYNELGQVTHEAIKHSADAEFETTKYTLGPDGEILRLKYSSGLIVKYHYDNNGSVVRVTGLFDEPGAERFVIAKDIAWSNGPHREVTSITFGNGIASQYNRSDNNRINYIAINRNGSPLDRFDFGYSSAGLVDRITRLESSRTQTFAYDTTDQIVQESRGQGDYVSYLYDSGGNRLRKTGARSVQYSYDNDSNRLEQVGQRAVDYDSLGNIIADRNGKRRFEYDANNRMSAFYKDEVLKATYKYDANGRRVEKTIHNGRSEDSGFKSIQFMYARNGLLLSELARKSEVENRVIREYVWLGDLPLAQIQRRVGEKGETKRTEVSFVHADHLNTPRLATSLDGAIVWRWESDAFGLGSADRDVDGDGNRVNIRLRFSGQYNDQDNGLFHNRFRDYDPRLGRYVQPDPLGLHGGGNRYVYTEGNPLNLTDPFGLAICGNIMVGTPSTGGHPDINYPVPCLSEGYIETNFYDEEWLFHRTGNAVIDDYLLNTFSKEDYCTTDHPDIVYANISPNGGIVDAYSSQIQIYPRSLTIPLISLPGNAVNASGFSTNNLSDHVYNVYTPAPPGGSIRMLFHSLSQAIRRLA